MTDATKLDDVDINESGVSPAPAREEEERSAAISTPPGGAEKAAATPSLPSGPPPRAEGEVLLSMPPGEADPATADLVVGTVIDGKYRLDEVLGRGAMGVVIAATHLALRERVALKFLSARTAARGEDFQSRFRREAQLSAKLRNEHITRVIDVGVWQGKLPFMVMEHLTGMDLAALIKKRGPLPVDVALDYVVQICAGMAEAHGLGVVHRDLKPSNVFVIKRPDGSDLVKILDFGISKWSVDDEIDDLTRSGMVLGSPKYMAVEQLFGSAQVDGRADVWSIGAILYAMLCGKSPYDFPTITRLCAELATNNPPPSLSQVRADVPPALEAVIVRCFDRERSLRVQNVADLAGDLLDAVQAPFAGQVRKTILGSLDPKRTREEAAQSGSSGTGPYRTLNLASTTGAAVLGGRPTEASPSPSLTDESTEARLIRASRTRTRAVVAWLAALSVVLLVLVARGTRDQAPALAPAAAVVAPPPPNLPAPVETAPQAAQPPAPAPLAPSTAAADPAKAVPPRRAPAPPRVAPPRPRVAAAATTAVASQPVTIPAAPAAPSAPPKSKASLLEDRQ